MINTERWKNIQEFNLDSALDEYGFSLRLAKENFWTEDFTERAILEYKKFMYLASVSDLMVSPSEVIDQVWHQHLIFTQSYQKFCDLLEKQVQHVPSTHNKEEFEKFKQARQRTRALYKENFGEPPADIWEYADMFASLNLTKARVKLRSFLVVALLISFALLTPLYFVLQPVYVHIGNPDFVIGYLLLAVLGFAVLEFRNHMYLSSMFEAMRVGNFISRLHPLELVYLKSGKLAESINGVVNHLLVEKQLEMYDAKHLVNSSSGMPGSKREQHVLESVSATTPVYYSTLMKVLKKKPVFSNISNCMDALKKYIRKSQKFGRLFYTNFYILVSIWTLGFVRLMMGVIRDKPVAIILIAVIVLAVVIVWFLNRLCSILPSQIIPEHYTDQMRPIAEAPGQWDWQYFILGTVVLLPAFRPIAGHPQNNSGDGGGGGGGCSAGSSCGSSCGGGCGGCGGGD